VITFSDVDAASEQRSHGPTHPAGGTRFSYQR